MALLYIITGIVGLGAYEQLPQFFRFTFAWCFPIHFALYTWFKAIERHSYQGILNNEPFWVGAAIIVVVLTVICGG